jgi:hypothetical protein
VAFGGVMQTATCGALGPRDVLLSCGLSGMAYAYCAASLPRVWRGVPRRTPSTRLLDGVEGSDPQRRRRATERQRRWRIEQHEKNAGASRASP